MVRFSIVLFAALFSTLTLAQTPFKELNLSVTFPEDAKQSLTNRAQRIEFFERTDRHALTELDELDQDIEYMRRQHSKKSVNLPLTPPLPELTFNPRAKSILFLDMNFAPAEILAAAEVARQRGENLLIYPERTAQQQTDIEREYRRLIQIKDNFKHCAQAQPRRDCSALRQEWLEAETNIQQMTDAFKKIDKAELQTIIAGLNGRGVKLSNIILSGHSGGDTFGGLLGWIGSDDLLAVFTQYPAPVTTVKSILLWGCYSGTLYGLTEYWQKKFPSIKAFMGYRNQAPLGIRPASGRLLKSYLKKEAALLAASTQQALHRSFRALDLVAVLDGTAAIGDYYLSYDQAGKISDYLSICDNFDSRLMDQFICYDKGQPGCENPPADHRGPLREFYSFLQVNRHCERTLAAKYPTLPSPESLIRLIYLDNIKGNFENHHKAYFQSFADYANELALTPDSRFESFVHSTRKDDVARVSSMDQQITALGARDLTYLDRSDFKAIMTVQHSLARLLLLLGHSRYGGSYTCVPFSWVDPGAQEPDECRVDELLERPRSEALESTLLSFYYEFHIDRFARDTEPFLNMLRYASFADRVQLKTSYFKILEIEIGFLEGLPSRSVVEGTRLALYRQLQTTAMAVSEVETIRFLKSLIPSMITKIEQLTLDAQSRPYNQAAIENLKYQKDLFLAADGRLDELLAN